METTHRVSLYEINGLSIVEMTKENISEHIDLRDSWLFIDNIHVNKLEMLDFDINSQSEIKIVCNDSWTIDFYNVTLHLPSGEMIPKRMTASEILDEITPLWVFVDNNMIGGWGNLQLNEGSEIEILSNNTPHNKILIQSHGWSIEKTFDTNVADASGGYYGAHTLAEINSMIPAPDVSVDGQMITYSSITVELHEQSEFRITPPLRGNCSSLDCGCGGERRHDVRMITDSLINKGKSDNGCWSSDQLVLLGIANELNHLEVRDMIETRIGQLITAGNYQKFVQLKNCHLGE
jgi:hypothetical protein